MANVEIQFGACKVQFEAKSVKDVFQAHTAFEVLTESKCEACESTQIVPRHRVAQGYDFYSFICLSCRAELHLGQKREGDVLFPRRKDKDGNWLENRGWVKFQPQQQTSEYREPVSHTQPPEQASPF